MINKIFKSLNIFLQKKEKKICYYKLNNKDKIYFNKDLNNLLLKKCQIKTIKDGKKLFYRFLKENNFFESYLNLLKIGNYSVDFIIMEYFYSPFCFITQFLLKHFSNEDNNYLGERKLLKKIIELDKQWNNLLNSINFFN